MKPLTRRGLTRAELRGYSIVPLLTPVTPAGEIDEAAVGRLVDHVFEGGCQGVMVCGTTGEFASLSIDERLRMARVAQKASAGRLTVFGGIGDTAPAHSRALARAFLDGGADAVVANLPSYYPLTPEMMERYFGGLADAIAGPMYLYNIPQTTRQSIPLEVLEKLSHHPWIVGVKDSEPDGARQEELCRRFAGREDYAVFCGSVALTSRAMRAGADGFVPGAGNVFPRLTRELMAALVAGPEQTEEADRLQVRMDAVNAVYQKGRTISQMFGALKAVAELCGLCSRTMVPPLIDATDAEVAQIRGQLRELGLLD
jgi:dihydrodipicolinate synthase/N-acetylneuraminate lyase